MDQDEIEIRALSKHKNYFHKSFGMHPGIFIGVFLFSLGIIASGLLFFKYQKAQQEIKNLKVLGTQNQKTQDNPTDLSKVISNVSKLMRLPTGEEPTVATIVDIDKVKTQPAFQNARNGDKILLYANAKKMIIYNPADNVIDDVVSISSSASITPSSSPSAIQQSPVKVGLKNGTTAQGLAAKMENDIKKSFPDINLTSRDNAVNTNYDKSLLIVFNQTVKDYAEKLAKAFNLSIDNLPPGESQPQGVDLLIIVGKDKI